MNAAQGIQYDQPGTAAKLNDASKMQLIHHIQAPTHDRLKSEVLRDGFP